MQSERKSIRYAAHGAARIEGAFEGEALLKNISITGCCIECTMHVDIKPNVEYTIEIIPENIANIGRFELIAECRWVRVEGYSRNIGFVITTSPKGKPFQRYVDYLSWRSAS
jgi:hypothetical protein